MAAVHGAFATYARVGNGSFKLHNTTIDFRRRTYTYIRGVIVLQGLLRGRSYIVGLLNYRGESGEGHKSRKREGAESAKEPKAQRSRER